MHMPQCFELSVRTLRYRGCWGATPKYSARPVAFRNPSTPLARIVHRYNGAFHLRRGHQHTYASNNIINYSLEKQVYAFAHMELHEMSETIGTSTHVPIRFKDGTTGPTPVYPPYPTWLTRAFMDGSCEAYMSYLSYCMSRVLSNEHEIKLAKDGVVSKDHLPAEMYELTPKVLFESVLVSAVFGHLPALRRALHKSAIGRVVSPAYRVEAHQTTLVNQAFQLACRHGNMHIVEYLLTECDAMLDVHCNNEGGFQEACEQKQTSIIQKLLQQRGKHAADPAAVARTQNADIVRAALAEYVPVETMLSAARAAWGCPITAD